MQDFFNDYLHVQNAKGYMSWLDVSVGQKIAGFSTGHGRLDVMCQNPQNAVVCLGHNGGECAQKI